MDKLTDEEGLWFDALGVLKLEEIYESVRNAMKDDGTGQTFLRCFAIAQSAAIDAGGFLEYHEGQACDKVRKTRQRHAWNTFHGEIIDLTWPPCLFRDYEPEKSYTFAEVKAVVSTRNGIWDWLNNPERDQIAKLKSELSL